MKFFIITLGCKVNQYESEAMHDKIVSAGFEYINSWENADIVIVNSCTVTAKSDQKARQILHKIRRENPGAILVLTGCMPQAFPETARLLEADIILGNSNRMKIIDYINRFILSNEKVVDIIPHENGEKFEKMEINDFYERTRAFVKIEDGCDRFCSYCIIPYARGRVRSKPMADIMLEVNELADNGYKEIVLSGINLSAYKTSENENLCDVVENICKIDKIERVRLSSLEPDQISEETIKRLAAEPKFCPQFHLSLQSGCDETLKRMNRHYNSSEYFEIVKNIRKYFNNPSITTDIMVGFPGETEEEFHKSLEFAKKVGFAKVHVFPYSIRPGTRAAEFDNQITNAEKKLRSQKMIETTNKTRKDFLDFQVGKVENVLFETNPDFNIYEGYTPNYTPVRVKSDINIKGKALNVRIISADDDYCISEIVS